jgi:hypothetical protein
MKRSKLALEVIFSAVYFVLALALVTASAHAATYFVATGGSDKNDGSSASPWLTLQKAADTVVPGDTVIVKDGAYAGWHVYGKKGTAAAPITFKAENPGRATLNAASPTASEKSIVDMRGNADSTNDYWVVDGFVIDGVNKSFMTLDCRWVNYCTFRNITTHGSNSRGLYISHGNNNLTENCTSYENDEHGSYQANASLHNAYVRNVCYKNRGNGMQANGDLSMGGNGIVLYTVYDKNTVYDNRAKGFNYDGACESTFKNNLVYNNASGGYALFQIDAAKSASDDLLYNNTVVQPVGTQWCIEIPSAAYNNGPGPDPVGHKIKNNILCDASGHGSIMVYDPHMKGLESDYNVVSDVFSVDNGTSTINFAAWQKLGYDLHSILSDPSALFVNVAANDYHLKAGSPAIDAGTALSEVADDMDATARPQGKGYDIGCYEFRGAASPAVMTTEVKAESTGRMQ